MTTKKGRNPWNILKIILLILQLVPLAILSSVYSKEYLEGRYTDVTKLCGLGEGWSFVIFVSVFFGLLPIIFVVTNSVLYLIPGARRSYSDSSLKNQDSFSIAMRQSGKMLLYVTLPACLLFLMGFGHIISADSDSIYYRTWYQMGRRTSWNEVQGMILRCSREGGKGATGDVIELEIDWEGDSVLFEISPRSFSNIVRFLQELKTSNPNIKRRLEFSGDTNYNRLVGLDQGGELFAQFSEAAH